MSQMDDRNKAFIILLVVAFLMLILVGIDLIADDDEGASLGHLITESILLCISAGAFVFSLKNLLNIRSENKNLLIRVQSLNAEKEQWKAEASEIVRGLSSKIEQQFGRWNLTPAETEVGFLLLKGFALKEIAEIRGTKLKTVQQQSQSIYSKTDIANRSELSAFFLEDLLPPLREPE